MKDYILRSALVEVNPDEHDRIAIVGDIHGDYEALDRALKHVNSDSDLLVFLGDYADRGTFGVEVIRKIAGLQEEHPKNVIALMGNHEDYTDEGIPKFSPCTLIDEAEGKVGSWYRYFEDVFKPFLDSLHLSTLVPKNALLVHGGVSSKLLSVDDLRSPSESLRRDILWSDPFRGNGEHPNMRGAGVEFGADVSASVCQALGIKRIIRSHQPTIARSKPNYAQDGRVVTVQCTSVYGGQPFVYFINPKSVKKDSFLKVPI